MCTQADLLMLILSNSEPFNRTEGSRLSGAICLFREDTTTLKPSDKRKKKKVMHERIRVMIGLLLPYYKLES